MRKILLTLILIFTISLTYSRTLTSTGNGDGANKNSWTPKTIPTSGDTIVILAGDTIFLNNSSFNLQNIILKVYGVLDLQAGTILGLFGNSKINIYKGGMIYGDKFWSLLIVNWYPSLVYDTLKGPISFDGNGLGTLPIKLISFEGTLANNILTTNWSTESELNNARFEIEVRDKDGNWETYSTVEGNGNSNRRLDYTTSFEYSKNYAYIRLVQYDYNGEFSKYKVIYVMSETVPKNQWDNVYTLTGKKVNIDNMKPGIYIIQFDGGNFKHIER